MWLPIIICSLFMQPFAQELEEVVVTAQKREQSLQDVPIAVSTIDRVEILRDGASAIYGSDAIAGVIHNIPALGYGSAVGQPIIRGMSGSRVKILKNGIVNRDVSGLGTDHLNDIDLNDIQQIEIVRGPSSLLYANGAIGGVINIVDNTIARKDFDEQSLNIGLGKQTASSGQDGSFNYKNNLDGFNVTLAYNNTDFGNYDVPSGAIMREDEASGGDDDIGQETTLQDSDFQSESTKFGISIVKDWGYFGFSLQSIESDYGIPFHAEEEDEQDILREHGDERIDLITMEGSYMFSSESINKIDYFFHDRDYTFTEHTTHTENTDDTSTDFADKTKEVRIGADIAIDSFNQKAVIDYKDSTQSVIGEEAYMAPVDFEEMTLGYYLSGNLGNVNLDLGIRIGQSDLSQEETDNRDFNTTSLALGIGGDLADGISARFGISSAERAPSAVELYMNGPHLAIQRFEIGKSDLKAESSQNFDVTINYNVETTYAVATHYHNDVDNYIYLSDTNETDDSGLTKANYLQRNAKFEGYKAELGRTFNVAGRDLGVSFARETVTGEFTDGANVPRIAPARNIYSFTYSISDIKSNLTLSDVAAQKDVATNETTTDGYQMLDASFSMGLKISNKSDLKVSLFANNLLDEVARNHTSFVKDEVPLPGRNYGLKFNLTF